MLDHYTFLENCPPTPPLSQSSFVMKTMLFFCRKYFSIPFGEWQLIMHAVSNVEFHRSKLIDIPSSWLLISRLLVFFARGLAFKRFIKPRASGRNIVGQQLPTLWDVTCCVRFTPCCMLLYVFACCWELLRKGWKRSNFWASKLPTFLLFRDRRSVGPKNNVGSICTALPSLLGPRTRISHTWCPKSYWLYPSHDAVQVPTLFGVVASFCTPLPTRTQQLSTLLEPTMLGVVPSVCTPLPSRTQQFPTLLEPTMLGIVASVCT